MHARTHAIDTNILVYAFDKAYPQKKAIARSILEACFTGQVAYAVTNQILAEFASAVTSRIEKPLSQRQAQAIVNTILKNRNWHVYNYTGKSVIAALDVKKHFWDCLIAETLKENGISGIITENAKDFAGTGLVVKNPFS